MTTAEYNPERRNHVDGPKGWTQSFDDDTVDLLERMGIIRWVKTTSSNGWEVKFYEKCPD